MTGRFIRTMFLFLGVISGMLFSQTLGPVEIPNLVHHGMNGLWGRGEFNSYNTVCRNSVVAPTKDKIMLALPSVYGIMSVNGGLTFTQLDGTPGKTVIHGDVVPPELPAYPYWGRYKGPQNNIGNTNYQASFINNDLYVCGWFCCNDNARAPIWFRKLSFDGISWTKGNYGMPDDSATKCMPNSAVELSSGRIWYLANNIFAIMGFGQGIHAKYSDDGGQTWLKANGSRVVSHYGGCEGPYFAVPYKNGVAVIWGSKETAYSDRVSLGWSVNLPDQSGTPTAWTPFETVITGDYYSCKFLANSVTVMGVDQIFIAATSRADSLVPGLTLVASCSSDVWTIDTLGQTRIMANNTGADGGDPYLDGLWPTDRSGLAIITKVGADVYCAWGDKGDDGKYRILMKKRLDGHRWSDSTVLTEQTERIYQMGSPNTNPDGRLILVWEYANDAAGPATGGIRLMNCDLSALSITRNGLPIEDNRLRIIVTPDPFNPSTSIRCTDRGRTIASGTAKLEIFDIKGKKMADLSNRLGPSSICWNAAGLSTGYYIARLKVDGKTASRSMFLIK
ncbi:MAG: T9SS type A sorting domain-containing protein [Fibrobacterota bacterium]